MKRNRLTHAAIAVALVLPAVSPAQEPRPRAGGGGGTVLKTSLDFAKHLDGPAKWTLGTAGTVTLKMDGDSTVFLLNDTEEVYRLKAPDYVDEAVTSDDGKTLILTAMKSRGFGSDFGTLVLVRAAAEPGKLEIRQVLERSKKLFGEASWWLADLGAISNDGTRILARFGVQPEGDNRMSYRWHTVELATGKILGEGLTIENGKTAAKP